MLAAAGRRRAAGKGAAGRRAAGTGGADQAQEVAVVVVVAAAHKLGLWKMQWPMGWPVQQRWHCSRMLQGIGHKQGADRKPGVAGNLESKSVH